MPRPLFARCRPYWFILLVLLFAFLARGGMASSSASERWVRTYTTAGNQGDAGTAVAVDTAGNSYVAGTIQASGGLDMVLLKYDAQGTLLWQRTFNGTGNGHELARKVRVDPSGSVLVVGSTYGGAPGSGGTGTDIFLRKYDPEGTLLWSRLYNGTGNSEDYPQALELDAAGDAYLAGTSGSDIVTLHYGADGTVAWARLYNGPDNKKDEAADLELDANGNVFVGGSVEGPPVFGAPDWDYVVLKYSPSGSLIVDRIYDTWSRGWNKLAALAIDAQGNVCVTGENHGPSGATNVETVKYNNHLEQLWYYWYNNERSGEDNPRDICTDSQGNIYVLSQSEVTGKWWDWLVVKYSPTGVKQWESNRGVGFNYLDNPLAMVIDLYDGIYVTGYMAGDDATYSNLITAKLDPNGSVWGIAYHSPVNRGNSSGAALAVDPAGNVFVTGTTTEAGTGQNLVLLKYAQTPEAVADTYSLNEDQPLTAPAPGVLANDRGDGITAEIGTEPAHGTLSLNPAGSFTYAPDADYAGPDSFSYRAFDGAAYSDFATVSLTVVPVDDPPVAQNDEYPAVEDTLLTVAAASGVLANDLDVEGDSLTAAVVTAPAHGMLTLNANGSFTYQPEANFAGTDTFTYRARAGGVDSNAATVTLTVAGVNDPPSATAQSLTTAEDTPLGITLSGIDADGDPLTYAVTSGPLHGTLSGTPPALTYTSAADYAGPDSAAFRVNDGTVDSAAATVSLTVTPVNDAPTGLPESFSVEEDQVLAVAAPGLLANDSDSEGDALTSVVETQPGHGSLTLNADGSFTYTSAPNYSGPDSFCYYASDGEGQSAPVTVTLTVNSVNDVPVATPQSLTTAEDTALPIQLSGSDVESDPLTYTVATQPAHGTLSGMLPALTYTPAPDYYGADSFTFRANDGTADSAPAVVALTVTPVNDAPAAQTEAYTLDEDQSLVVAVPGVLANDADVEGEPLTSALDTQPGHGSLTLNGDGSFTYTPEPNYAGPDSFRYHASDGTASSAVITVTLSVAAVNDAPTAAPQMLTTAEDTALPVMLSGGDVEGDPLTYTVVAQPAHGTLSGTAPDLVYTPAADYAGADSFTFRVNDGTVDSPTATISLTITPINDPPVTVSDSYSTPEDAQLSVAAAQGLLANDRDADGDSLTVTRINGPAHGTLALQEDGSFTFIPAANYQGSDSFTYRLSDGTTDATGTVSLTITSVPDAPTAGSFSVTTAEDTSRSIALQGSDADGDSLTFQVLTGPAHGTLTGSGSTRTYAPAANYAGPDSFTYQVSDGAAASSVAMVSITVTPVNDTPTAQGQSLTTPEDTPLAVTLSASDVEGSPLVYTLVSQPQHGLLSGTPSALTYTPAANYAGPDSFTFRAGDGVATSAPATVSITVTPVNDPPSPAADSYAGTEDLPLTVAAPGVLANDSDLEGGLHAELEATAQHGELQLNGDGSFVYTPAPNFHGTDQFRYRPSDGVASGPATTVTLTIAPAADPPVAAGQSLTTPEDTALVVALSGSDPDGDALSYTVGQPAHGTLSGAAPSLTYTPAADYTGPDSFTFRVSDGTAQSGPATVTLTVTPVDDAPAGGDDAYTLSEDATLQIAAPGVLANDLDAEGAALQAVLLSDPAHGTVSLSANGAFVYTPAPDFHGTDGFEYLVFGGGKASSPVTVLLVVTPVNDAPVAAPQSLATAEDTPVGGTLTGSDVDGASLTYRIVSAPAHGTVTGTLPSFTYTPASNYHGADQFTFAVSDGTAESAPATVLLTLVPVNDAPTATAEAYSTGSATRLSVAAPGVLGNDVDPDGDPLTAVLLAGPVGGDFTLDPDGSFIYQPWPGFSGEDGFTYRAADSQSPSATVRVILTVGEVPASGAGGKVSGSGKVELPGGQSGTLRVSASLDRRGRLKGQFTLKNLTTRQQVKSAELLALQVTGTRARLYGRALVNGTTVSFVLDVYDAPKPARDQAGLLTGNGGGFAISELTSGKLTVKP